MNSPANHAAGDRLLARLNAALREQWNYGSDALVGWRPCEDSVAYLYAPALKIFSSVKAHRRIVHSERMMGVRTFANTAKITFIKPNHSTKLLATIMLLKGNLNSQFVEEAHRTAAMNA